MAKKLFENANIVFELMENPSIFHCSECGQMGSEAPIRSQILQGRGKGKFSSYHQECAVVVIRRIQEGDKRTSEQKLSIPSQVKVSTPAPVSRLIPIIDEELERKKKKLKAILQGNEIETIAQEAVAEKAEAKPKARIDVNEFGNIYLVHKFDKGLVDKYHFIKQIKWQPNFKYWDCDVSTADYETCRFLLKIYKEAPQYDWLVSEDAYEKIKSRLDYHESIIQQSREIKEIKSKVDIDIDLSYLKLPPFPYQKVGIAFLDKIHGVGMIGDEMGLGKSLSAIGYTSARKLKTIIVCPASLKYNWQNEIKKFTNLTSFVMTELLPEEFDPKNLKYDYYIINYEQLQKYEKFFKKAKFDCVVLDESHYIKDLQAKRTKSVYKYFKKVPHRLLLSGTPIKNRPLEFYSQLKFLRADLFSNKQNYALRYCDAKEDKFGRWDYSGASNLEELNRKIANFYIRREKKDVLKELPEKTVSLVELDLNVNEKNEYNRINKDFYKVLDESWKQYGSSMQNMKIGGNQLSKMMEMKQFCSHHKISRIIEYVREFLESSEDRKIIIFSQFIHTQRKLRDAFPGQTVSILGENSDIERQEAVDRFQSDPKIRVFVGSTIAAGIGITLTAADTVCFADLMWSPSDHLQAEDRAYRIGQKNNVQVNYFVFKDTIEEMIWKTLSKKLGVIMQALDGKRQEKSLNEDVVKTVFNEILEDFKARRGKDD